MIYPAAKKVKAELLAPDCKVVNGLYTGGGVSPLPTVARIYDCPENMVGIKYLPGCKRFAMYADGVSYSSFDGVSFAKNFNLTATKPVMFEEFHNGNPTGYVAGDKIMVMYFGYNITSTLTTPYVRCAAVHRGRLFGGDKDDPYKLKWSGEGGSQDVNGGIFGAGYAHFDPPLGEIINVCDLGEELAVVRDYGITVMRAGGAPDTFSFDCSHAQTPRILPDTAEVINGRLYFYTRDGLYSFANGAARREDVPLRSDISAPTGCACGGGRYYLCGRSNFLGGKNAVFVYDGIYGASALIDIPAQKIAVADDTVVCYGGGKSYKLGGGGAARFYRTEGFGTSGKKCLTSLSVRADSPVDIKITADGVTRTVTGVTHNRKLTMCGREFTFEVGSEGRVYSVTAEAEVINGI